MLQCNISRALRAEDTMSTASDTARFAPERAARLSASAAAAPLWAAFAVAAGAGVTYWWMTAWARQRGGHPALAEPRSFAPVTAAPSTAFGLEQAEAYQAVPVVAPVIDPLTEVAVPHAEAIAAHSPPEPLESPALSPGEALAADDLPAETLADHASVAAIAVAVADPSTVAFDIVVPVEPENEANGRPARPAARRKAKGEPQA